MTQVHQSAVVAASAQLGEKVSVGPGAVVEDEVVIGDGSQIGSNVLLGRGAVLGQGVKLFHGAVVGTVPQDLKFGGEETEAIIGDDTIIREYATVNRGTIDRGKTEIGRNCLIMAYAHVAHDCCLGDNVIMANSVNLAGHIEIDDFAIIGGIVPVHQFVKIGTHAMVGGGFRVQQDVCPYALVGGYPLKVVGLNSIGLKRRGFSKEAVRTLERTFKLLFFSKLNTSQAVERIRSDIEMTDEVKTVLGFIERSTRGLVK